MGSLTPQCLRRTRDLPHTAVLPSGSPVTVGASDFGYFGAHQLQGYPACTCPYPTLRVRRYRRPHMARGQDGFAIPFLYDSFIHYFTPVYPDASRRFRLFLPV